MEKLPKRNNEERRSYFRAWKRYSHIGLCVLSSLILMTFGDKQLVARCLRRTAIIIVLSYIDDIRFLPAFVVRRRVVFCRQTPRGTVAKPTR